MEGPPFASDAPAATPGREATAAGDAGSAAGAVPAGPSNSRLGQLLELLAVLSLTHLPSWAGVLWPAPPSAPVPFPEQIIGSFHIDVPVVAVMLLLMAWSGEGWAAYGIRRPRWLFDLGYALLLLMILTVLRTLLPVGDARPGPSLEAPDGALEESLLVATGLLSVLVEELVGRAYLIVRLGRLLRSSALSVLVAAALFASWHLHRGPAGVLATFCSGVVYGMVFVGLGRIWPLVITHGLWNLVVATR